MPFKHNQHMGIESKGSPSPYWVVRCSSAGAVAVRSCIAAVEGHVAEAEAAAVHHGCQQL
jgi:hypothetical protein